MASARSKCRAGLLGVCSISRFRKQWLQCTSSVAARENYDAGRYTPLRCTRFCQQQKFPRNLTPTSNPSRTLCGTPNYIAPEILDGKEGHSYEVDVWSIGCILYTLLIGKPPFETNNIKTTYRKIKSNDYRIPSSANISEDARSLIRDMLHRDPTRRPSLQTIRAHPFLTQGFCPATLPLSSLTVAPTFSSARESKTAKDLAPRHALRTVNGNQGRAGFHSARTDTGAARKPSVSAPRRAEREPGYRSSAMNPPSSSTTTHAVASDELGRIHRQLTSVTTRQATVKGTVAPRPVPTAKASQGLWICKWVDYSNKYGLGYQLSDNSVGVLFNDATKIILAPDQQYVAVFWLPLGVGVRARWHSPMRGVSPGCVSRFGGRERIFSLATNQPIRAHFVFIVPFVA